MKFKIYYWEHTNMLVMIYESGQVEICPNKDWFYTSLPKFTKILSQYMEMIYES